MHIKKLALFGAALLALSVPALGSETEEGMLMEGSVKCKNGTILRNCQKCEINEAGEAKCALGARQAKCDDGAILEACVKCATKNGINTCVHPHTDDIGPRDAICYDEKGVDTGVVLKNCKACEKDGDGHFRCAKCADSYKLVEKNENDENQTYIIHFEKKPSHGMCVAADKESRCRKDFVWKDVSGGKGIKDQVSCRTCDSDADPIDPNTGLCVDCPKSCEKQGCTWDLKMYDGKGGMKCKSCPDTADGKPQAASFKTGLCVLADPNCDDDAERSAEGECTECKRYKDTKNGQEWLLGFKDEMFPVSATEGMVCKDWKSRDRTKMENCKSWLSEYELVKTGETQTCIKKSKTKFEKEVKDMKSGWFTKTGNDISAKWNNAWGWCEDQRTEQQKGKHMVRKDGKCYECPVSCGQVECKLYEPTGQAKSDKSVYVRCEAKQGGSKVLYGKASGETQAKEDEGKWRCRDLKPEKKGIMRNMYDIRECELDAKMLVA